MEGEHDHQGIAGHEGAVRPRSVGMKRPKLLVVLDFSLTIFRLQVNCYLPPEYTLTPTPAAYIRLFETHASMRY